MVDSVYLEVVAALAVILSIAASVVAALNQWVTQLLSIRAKVLWRTLARALDPDGAAGPDLGLRAVVGQAVSGRGAQLGDGGLVTALADAPAIRALAGPARRVGTTLADNIPAEIFARSLVAVAAGDDEPTIEALRRATAGTAIGDIVATAAADGQATLDTVTAAIERWFDGQMGRLSDLYRSTARTLLFVAGLVLAVAANINTFGLVGELRDNLDVRTALTGAVELCAEDDSPQDCSTTVLEAVRASDRDVPVPLVGSYRPPWDELAGADGVTGPIGVVAGWMVTAVAVALGAPFWFDTARRFSGLGRR